MIQFSIAEAWAAQPGCFCFPDRIVCEVATRRWVTGRGEIHLPDRHTEGGSQHGERRRRARSSEDPDTFVSREERTRKERERSRRSFSRLLIRRRESRGRSSASSEMGPLAMVPLLESRGYQVDSVDSDSEGLAALRRKPPELLILAVSRDRSVGPGTPGAELRAAAQEPGNPGARCPGLRRRSRPGSGARPEADDWVLRGSSADEIAARVARLLRSRKPVSATAARAPENAVDTRFTSLVVHDLRTPLNVIGLSFRMIEQVLPRDDPDVAEDIQFIEENFRQLERMLSQLGDYSRLCEPELTLSVSEFSPRRLVEELLENREARPGGKKPSVQLDLQKTCPEEAALDQMRARLAIDYALANACAAAHGEPVRLTLRGRPQRLIIEVAIDRPPPSSVESIDLRPHSYERLCGSAAERRGMDLAIAARVSELFGGTARLDAVAGAKHCHYPRLAGPYRRSLRGRLTRSATAVRRADRSVGLPQNSALGMRVALCYLMLMAVDSCSPSSARGCDRSQGTL